MNGYLIGSGETGCKPGDVCDCTQLCGACGPKLLFPAALFIAVQFVTAVDSLAYLYAL